LVHRAQWQQDRSHTPEGTITEFTLPAPDSYPNSIAAGPDGNLWFVESNGGVGRITPTGTITELPCYGTSVGTLVAIAAGPDGNLWVTENFGNAVGRLTTEGACTWFDVPHSGDGTVPEYNGEGITAGPDGKIWFTEGLYGNVDCIAP
jgi:virginiamycin B lyase